MYKNLVISSGGIKTFPLLGSIKYLDDNGYLKTINSYYATSAGSIYCMMMILGYTVAEITELFTKINVGKLFHLNLNIDNFFVNYNLYDRTNFITTLKKIIVLKTNNDEITLEELYKTTKKTITCAAVNVGKGTVKYFNWKTDPTMPLITLISMTCAVPLLFSPVMWNDELYVDGALIDNCPSSVVDNPDKTICISIKSLPVEVSVKFDNIMTFIERIATIGVDNVGMTFGTCKTVKIKVNGIENLDLLNKNISHDICQKMIDEAYEETRLQLKPNIVRRNSF